MNNRHKTVLGLSLAIAGLALLNGAKLPEGLGIILVGGSLAWLIGSQFVLAGAMFVWRHRIWSATIAVLWVGAVYGWIRYDAYQTGKRNAAAVILRSSGSDSSCTDTKGLFRLPAIRMLQRSSNPKSCV